MRHSTSELVANTADDRRRQRLADNLALILILRLHINAETRTLTSVLGASDAHTNRAAICQWVARQLPAQATTGESVTIDLLEHRFRSLMHAECFSD